MPKIRELKFADYEALLKAYRDVPGNYARAARRAGVNVETAKLAWKRGFKFVNPDGSLEYRDPISRLLATEQEREQKRILDEAEIRAQEEERAKVLAREEALKIKDATGKLLVGGQTVLANTAVAFQRLSRGAHAIMETLVDKEGNPTEELRKLSVPQRLAFLTQLANGARHWTSAFHEWQQAARLHHGQPESILGIQAVPAEDQSPQELIEATQAAAASVARYAGMLQPGSVETLSEEDADDGTPQSNGGNGAAH